jgi:hypothetical protein
MLSLEEYVKNYPNSKYLSGSFAGLSYITFSVIREGFLEFTKESAIHFAPPFQGKYARFVLRDYSNAIFSSGPNKGKKVLEIWSEIDTASQGIASLNKPINLWLVGADDSSWAKNYSSEKEALNELELFIVNEPLDFHEVIDFGFIFTN